MTVTGVKLLLKSNSNKAPIPAMENPYPNEMNHTNFLKPMALMSMAARNRIKNCIKYLLSLFKIII